MRARLRMKAGACSSNWTPGRLANLQATRSGNSPAVAGSACWSLSERACASLGTAQKAIIERSATLLPLRVPTIELAGGSVRCMLAGIHRHGGPSVPAQAMAGRDRAGMGGVALLWAAGFVPKGKGTRMPAQPLPSSQAQQIAIK